MGTTDPSWTTVGKQSDLVPGAGVGARYGERQIALFWIPELDNRILAVDNYCPVSGVNIISRGIVGDIEGEPVVATPLYKKHFSLLDGRCIEDPETTLQTFSVRVIDSEVQIAPTQDETSTAREAAR